MSAPKRDHGHLREKIVTSCSSKNRYVDQPTAIAMGMRQEDMNAGLKMYHYACTICRGWHITHYAVAPNGRKNRRCSPDIFAKKG